VTKPRIFVGSYPIERPAMEVELAPGLSADIIFWPPAAPPWPPNKDGPDPFLMIGGHPSGPPDIYLHWGVEYNPLPIDTFDGDWEPIPLLGDWNVAGRIIHLCGRWFRRWLVDRPGRDTLEKHTGQTPIECRPWAWDSQAWPLHAPGGDRPIDMLFVGSRNAAIHRIREPFLRDINALAGSHDQRVVFRTWLPPDSYRSLALRSKAIFNLPVRGELNMRVTEAVSSGAVLVHAAPHDAVATLLSAGTEYVPVTSPLDVVTAIDDLRSNPANAKRIAVAGQLKLLAFTYESELRCILRSVWPNRELQRRCAVADRPDVRQQWVLAGRSSTRYAATSDMAWETTIRAEGSKVTHIPGTWIPTAPDFSWWRMALETALLARPTPFRAQAFARSWLSAIETFDDAKSVGNLEARRVVADELSIWEVPEGLVMAALIYRRAGLVTLSKDCFLRAAQLDPEFVLDTLRRSPNGAALDQLEISKIEVAARLAHHNVGADR
jgi:Glycosyl transferases group 1